LRGTGMWLLVLLLLLYAKGRQNKIQGREGVD
jgi:hypothetical protein